MAYEFEIDYTRRSIPQGDCYLIPIKYIPVDAQEIPAEKGLFIITHSESGHHHVIEERPDIRQFSGMDLLRGFLEVSGDEPTNLIHLRSTHTHETQKVSPGAWLIQRQGRPTPQGWAKAID